MKIFLYLKHFPPDGKNFLDGPSKSTHGFASGLVKCGANVVVLCEDQKTTTFKTDTGYEIKCFKNLNSYQTFKLAPELTSYIKSYMNERSLVLLAGIFHPSVYSMSRVLLRNKIPYIAVPRDLYHPKMFSKNPHLKWPYWYLFERKVLRDSLAIQLFEKNQARWLKRLGILKNFLESPNGFSPNDVLSIDNLSWTSKGKVKLFIFSRIDTHHKGLDLMLNALSILPKDIDFELTIQGPDEGDKSILIQQARVLELSHQVHFLEPDYVNSPTSIMAEYDVFCLPSRFEGFGNTVIEAMLAGRVVLVSKEAGTAQCVRSSGCGVVIEPEINSISSGLIDLIKQRPYWQEMGLRGRNYVLKHLSWSQIASNAMEAYQKLLQS
jgi:glycosyltransferase involved in cell wall biosynthesis